MYNDGLRWIKRLMWKAELWNIQLKMQKICIIFNKARKPLGKKLQTRDYIKVSSVQQKALLTEWRYDDRLGRGKYQGNNILN